MIDVTKVDLTSLYDSAAEIVRMYQEELETQKVNASNSLSQSADFDVDFDENDIVVYFIYNSYGYYIEHGRKPTGGGGGQSWANSLQDIENWMQSKISRGWWIPRQNQTIPRTPKELRQAAWLIRRKIHREGFYSPNSQGKHILRQVLDRAEASGLVQRMLDSVMKGFDNDINAEIEKI